MCAGNPTTFYIASWQSEPHYQHQNPAKQCYQDVKHLCNTVLDHTGAPAYCWLLCLIYICFVLNNCYSDNIKGVQIRMVTGTTNDISPLLSFEFYKPIYYHMDDTPFPSASKEYCGHWVGISENVGNFMTYKVLTDDTLRVIHHSNIHLARDPTSKNLHCEPLNDDPPKIIKSLPCWHTHASDSPSLAHGETVLPLPNFDDEDNPNMAIVDPQDLVGHMFLMDEWDDGRCFWACIVECINKHEQGHHTTDEHIKFRCSIKDDEYKEIISYNELMDFIQKNTENDAIVWKFQKIVGHQVPLKQNDPHYMGLRFNVQIEWGNGEIMNEPLDIITTNDPTTRAIYARENGLLNEPGWIYFHHLALCKKQLLCQVKQAKLRSFWTAPQYKFGYRVLHMYDEAIRLDLQNGSTLWQDAIELEMEQLHEYKCFLDYGVHGKSTPPEGYKKIKVHLIFDVEHNGQHKARCVGDGHLTDIPIDSVYSGVISLCGLQIVIFLSELNDLEMWSTDIGNAYLEAYTSKKLYIVTGPEFGELEGHILIISKALYGLRTSGLRWYQWFSDCLCDMGFTPSKAELDIWMRWVSDHYEYIVVYVDDLAIASKDPKSIIDMLTKCHGFKLKGMGPIDYHLGMTFWHNECGELCISPTRYIDKMVDTYVQLFGQKPSTKALSLLENGDHPAEIDDSEFLGQEDTQKYQSLVGAIQWAISIGHFDINTAVMTLSSFQAQPRCGHLECVKHIYSYLYKLSNAQICMCTQEPDYSDVPEIEYDWSKSVYGNISKLIPKDTPEPLGRHVTLTHYMDANFYHAMLAYRSFYYRHPPLYEQDSYQLVFQEAGYHWDINIWQWVCCSLYLPWSGCRPKIDTPLPWCIHQGEELYVWRQQVCCQQLCQAPV